MNLKPIPLRDPEIVEAEAREWRRENIEKVPTTSLTSLTVRGVELTSRYNKAHKFEAMQLAVLARTSMAACIRSIWCDSESTACYTVVLRCSTWDARLALPFAECLGDAFLNIQGGFDFINAEAATATPTTGFPLARIGRPRTKKLVGVVSEVSDPLSLSTRVYAHAPFVNDEVFGLCIVVDADGRSLTSLTRLTNAPLTAQPKTSPRGKKGRARPRPPRPEPRQTHPTARGILRGDRRREAARMIRVERHEEVRPGIWRHTVPGFGIEGRSRRHDAR